MTEPNNNDHPRRPTQWQCCPPGWHVLITQLDADLAAIDPDYTLVLAAAKGGGLLYTISSRYDSDDPKRQAMADLIAAARRASTTTCQRCGAPGQRRRAGRRATPQIRCTECAVGTASQPSRGIGADLFAEDGSLSDALTLDDDVSALPEWARELNEARVSPVLPRADVLGRDHEIAEVVAQLRRGRRRPVLIAGAPGSGRSSVVAGVANALHELQPSWSVVDVAAHTTTAVAEILATAPDTAVLTFDGAENSNTLVRLGGYDARLLIICAPGEVSTLCEHSPQTSVVPVAVLPMDVIRQVAERELVELTRVHAVAADPKLLDHALRAPAAHDRIAHPSLALDRIDSALARARLEGLTVATQRHLVTHDGRRRQVEPGSNLGAALAARVKGQDAAIDAVADHLSRTLLGLQTRRHRPNGVFLFVGPSGVGKTELAKEVTRQAFGEAGNLIRFDMSEFVRADDVYRLIGIPKGFKNSEQREHLLTSRVAQEPRSVVLLDEFEKAHPAVRNLFLQAFDDGRLTDGHNQVTSFADTVIIMTSNSGNQEASRRSAGFVENRDPVTHRRDATMAVLRRDWSPEFLNRIDVIACFDPLDSTAIAQITRIEVELAVTRLADEGWEIDVDDAVIEWLAAADYDPAFGARHVQRNIDRTFYGALAQGPGRCVRVRVDGDRLAAEALVIDIETAGGHSPTHILAGAAAGIHQLPARLLHTRPRA